MKRNFIGFVCLLALTSAFSVPEVYSASSTMFIQHYDAAQDFLAKGQYSSAIDSFRKALKINYMDNSARIGLINSYLARASYYANQERNYEKSANDFRSALFYLKIYPTKEQAIQNSSPMIASANENLNQCLKVISFDKTASARYKKAEELRAMGNFSASAFEFLQASQNEQLKAKAYVQIGDLLKLMGNETRSADYYKMALDINPSDNTLRMKYARSLDRLGRFDEAVVYYNSALATSKGDMELLFALDRIYQKKLAQAPNDAELYANIGAIKQAQGDFESALSYYNKAEQINPNNINTRLNLGTLFQQKKDYIKAIKAYDSVLTLYPDNVQANLYKAQVLSEAGDKKNALNLYKKVLSLDPANSIAKTEMVSVMQDSMSPDEFISYLVQNSANDKTMQATLYDYAYKLHKDKKMDSAISAYSSVISVNPNNVDAYVNLAICHVANGNYNTALEVLNNAKAKFPTNNLVLKTINEVKGASISTAMNSAAESYANKDYQKAITQYLSVNPATEDSLLGVAASYQALENIDKAIEFYKKAEEIAPKNADIPYYIGYLLSEQEKWFESETYLQKSISLNPNSEANNILQSVIQNCSIAMLGEGIDLYEKNNFEGALTKFNEVIKRANPNAYAYYYRGLIYDEQKKYKFALEDYNKFISSYTTDDEYLKYVKSRVEDLKQYAG